jgi:hypothetical protein
MLDRLVRSVNREAGISARGGPHDWVPAPRRYARFTFSRLRRLWLFFNLPELEADYVDLRNPSTRRLLAKASLRWRRDAQSCIVRHAKIVRDPVAIAEREARLALMSHEQPTKVLSFKR